MKNTRRLVHKDDVQVVGRATAKTPTRQNVIVEPSGDTTVNIAGTKCFHGTYIPANTHMPDNIAEFCSVCRPYELIVKKNSTYLA